MENIFDEKNKYDFKIEIRVKKNFWSNCIHSKISKSFFDHEQNKTKQKLNSNSHSKKCNEQTHNFAMLILQFSLQVVLKFITHFIQFYMNSDGKNLFNRKKE